MSRAKGNTYEGQLVKLLTAAYPHVLTAQRVPLSGAAGGMFADDVMVRLNETGFTFNIEVKFRKNPFREGFTRFLQHWERAEYRPMRIGKWVFYLLDDLMTCNKLREALDAKPVLANSVLKLPARFVQWAEGSSGYVAVRFPDKHWRKKWLVGIEDSSRAVLQKQMSIL